MTFPLGDYDHMMKSKISAGSTALVNGIPMCVDQDMHRCPIKGHGVTSVTGTASFRSGGKRGVKTGDVAGCGAAITGGSEDSSTD